MATRAPLEKAAITFINAREKKAKLKEGRAEQIKKCARPAYSRLDRGPELVAFVDLDQWDHLYMGDNTHFVLNETCVYKHPKDPEQWCDSCKKSNVLHEEFRAMTRKLTSARNALVKAVHTATKRS